MSRFFLFPFPSGLSRYAVIFWFPQTLPAGGSSRLSRFSPFTLGQFCSSFYSRLCFAFVCKELISCFPLPRIGPFSLCPRRREGPRDDDVSSGLHFFRRSFLPEMPSPPSHDGLIRLARKTTPFRNLSLFTNPPFFFVFSLDSCQGCSLARASAAFWCHVLGCSGLFFPSAFFSTISFHFLEG